MLIFSHFTFNNDDMRSSKRQVTFLSLIFLLKCFPKSTTITLLSTKKKEKKCQVFIDRLMLSLTLIIAWQF